MSFPALSAAVAKAARSAGAPLQADFTDGELLRSYARTRAEAPFADLVRRLGPMVLGVCRRVSGDRHLADDAFQAAFAVLARRAGDVRPAEAVRAWLYGVAVRTAREARAVSSRRLAREVPMPTIPDRAEEPVPERDIDAPAILDEEIAALPEHLRSAVVLCELDCVSRKDAARRLGIVEGTLSSRLAKARKLLARRLRKRGVSLPGAGLAVLAHAAVSPQLAAQTSALVSPSAPLSPAVAALTHGVLRTMFLRKLLIVPVLGLVASVVFAGELLPAADPILPAPAPVGATAEPAPATPALRAGATLADTKLEEAPPVVVKTAPESGADGVDPGLTEVKVTFSKTMTDKSWSWSGAQYGEFPLPKSDAKISYDKDARTCTATVKLEPGTTYAIWLNSEKFQNFKDADGRAAVPYLLVFRTKAK